MNEERARRKKTQREKELNVVVLLHEAKGERLAPGRKKQSNKQQQNIFRK